MIQIKSFQVRLEGLTPIMFDRYLGTERILAPEQKLYLDKDGALCLPAVNIKSFLSAQNYRTAIDLLQTKKVKEIKMAALSYINISPKNIKFLNDDKPIIFSGFDGKQLWVDKRKANVVKGKLTIPQEKERPVLGLPWALEFQIDLFSNRFLDEELLRQCFEDGGLAIGLGTFRGEFGKFEVKEWKQIRK